MSAQRPAPANDRLIQAGLVAWLAALFLLLLRLSWLKWGDPIIDTGRELEIPWKVASGRLLYRDMAYNYGPLSPLFHGLLFKLFGVHLRVVVCSGVLAAGTGAVLVWRACRTLADRTAACAIAAVFLLECAFQHYMPNGVFNFVLPYSFPAVHGTLLALGAYLAFASWSAGGGRGKLALAGTLAGLSLLCKVEMAFAILVPLALVPLLVGWSSPAGRRKALLDTAAWAGPCAGMTLAGFLPFVLATSFDEVVWGNVLRPQLVDFRSNLFFMKHLGLADLRTNLWRIALGLMGWAAAVALVGFAAALLGAKGKPQLPRRVLGGLVLAATGVAGWRWFPPGLEFSVLSAVSLAAALTYSWRVAARSGSPDPRTLRLAALALFSTLALLRMFITAGTFHYGFYLAVPALILLGVVLFSELPRAIPALGRRQPWYGTALACLLLVLSARSFHLGSMHYYRQKTVELRGARGSLRVSPEPYGVTPAAFLQQALTHLESAARQGETLLVLPEGATINFLSGQMNPTHYDVLIPPELEAPGVEDALIAQIEAARVDRILIVQRTVAEYGRRGLGIDYGLKLTRYIDEHYRTEMAFGPPAEGCVALRRREL